MNEKFIVTLKIVPNSSKNCVVKEDDYIKIKITSPPVDNKANKTLVDFLSKKLSVPKSAVNILKGETSKLKTISINGIDEEYFISHLL